jgi:hypothetical protein
MGGINAIVSPAFKAITCPDATYSSLSANVKESWSRTMLASLGYRSASIVRRLDVLQSSVMFNSIFPTPPAASRADAKNSTVMVKSLFLSSVLVLAMVVP